MSFCYNFDIICAKSTMSNHRTTVSIDKKTKELAEKRAKADQMSVSSVMRILLRDYADGTIDIGSFMVRDAAGFTPEKAEELDQALLEIKDGKNLSPGFENADDAITWLKQKPCD